MKPFLRIGKYVYRIADTRPYDVLKGALPVGDDTDPLRKSVDKNKSTLQWGRSLRPSFLPLSDFDDVEFGNLRDPILVEEMKDWLLERSWTGEVTGDRVIVLVDAAGNVKIGEGNHRIEALQELLAAGSVKSGYPVPTMIWYKGNSDLLEGAWIPKSKQ